MSDKFADSGTGVHLYYPYAPVTVGGTTLQVYTGETIEWRFGSGQAIPDGASPYQVVDAPKGYINYLWNTEYSVAAPDIRTMTADEWSTLIGVAAEVKYRAAYTAAAGSYSDEERQTWAQQVAQAQIVLDGGSSDLLTALAASRGVGVQALAQKIVAKSSTYNSAIMSALSALQAARAAKITDVSQAPAITVDDLITYRLWLNDPARAIS